MTATWAPAQGETAAVRRLTDRLDNPFLPPDEIRAEVEALDVSELRAFGFDLFYLNALWLHARRTGADAARRAAIDTVRAKILGGWEAEARFAALRGRFEACRRAGSEESLDAIPPTLSGWGDIDLSPTAAGVGPIIVLFHLPGYRYVASDLAFLGWTTNVPIRSQARERCDMRYYAGFPPLFHQRVRLLNVEQRGVTFSLAKALRRGESATMFADGNLGEDGSWDRSALAEVPFFTEHLLVKNGIPRLALATRAPIVPIFTRRQADGSESVIALPRIIPPARDDIEASGPFANDVMRLLYAALEREIARAPATWESLCLAHKWRADNPAAPAPPADAPSSWDSSGTWKVAFDPSRVADLSSATESLYVDVHTMKGMRPPAAAEDLFHTLTAEGVDAAWLCRHAPTPDARLVLTSSLAALSRRGLLLDV